MTGPAGSRQPTPTAGSLRKLIDRVLRGDADLDAFCLDHFPDVHLQFSAGMERKAKVNLLIGLAPRAEVLARLREEHPDAVREGEHLLKWDVAAEALFAGDFRLIRPLGRGGMGTVYEAEQLSTGMRRALKRMHPQLVPDPERRRRFEKEARAGSQIDSEHVVQVVAAGVDDHDTPWLAMELLDGEDLAAYLRRQVHLPLSEVQQIVSQLCHALAAAHKKGIVHRDLKPENIFLARSLRAAGPPLLVKVLDFGIAKLVSESLSAGTSSLGTPLWMAPEQTTPGRRISPAADVWAMGLLAFRMLCGHHYLLSADRKDPSLTEVMREVVLDPLLPSSHRAAEYGCAERLPAGFDAWFAGCVVREPEARFRSADEAYRAFIDTVGHAPIQATGQRNTAPLARVSRRGGVLRWAAVGAGATALTLSGIWISHLWLGSDSIVKPAPVGTATPLPQPLDVKPDSTCPSSMIRVGAPPPGTGSFCIDRYEYPGSGQSPHVNISVQDAEASCQRREARLCTEDEWEQACRGRGLSSYPYGWEPRPDACNITGSVLLPTGSRPQCVSAAGAFDMAGNAAEWTSDGSVHGGSARGETDGRCSRRVKFSASDRSPFIGFRCCARPKVTIHVHVNVAPAGSQLYVDGKAVRCCSVDLLEGEPVRLKAVAPLARSKCCPPREIIYTAGTDAPPPSITLSCEKDCPLW